MKARVHFIGAYIMRLIGICFLLIMAQISCAAILSASKQSFIKRMTTQIKSVDQEILLQRKEVLTYQKELQTSQHIPYSDYKNILILGAYYKAASCSPIHWQAKTCVNSLVKRVDILPTDLVLAQAINESNWGQSRFAKEGNNYFGIWCFTKGCGIVPNDRPAGEQYEVRKFVNMRESVLAYYRIINTHTPYLKLRLMRADMRAKGEALNASALAMGLEGYSTRKKAYVKSIQGLLRLLRSLGIH